MNDTGGGVTAIHDVPGDITRIGFHWMLFFPFCHSNGGFYFFFTRSVSEITGGLLVTNLRICEFFFFLHTECRGIIFFITNYRISFTRIVAEVTDFFLSRDLSLDPLTNGGVIAEFL